MARKQKIPTELHEYLKYCHSNKMTAPKLNQPQTDELQETAADCQGITHGTQDL
jgi:hypothetical protein